MPRQRCPRGRPSIILGAIRAQLQLLELSPASSAPIDRTFADLALDGGMGHTETAAPDRLAVLHSSVPSHCRAHTSSIVCGLTLPWASGRIIRRIRRSDSFAQAKRTL